MVQVIVTKRIISATSFYMMPLRPRKPPVFLDDGSLASFSFFLALEMFCAPPGIDY